MPGTTFRGVTAFNVDDRAVLQLYRRFPREVAIQLRDVFGQWGGKHRKEVSRRLSGKKLRNLVIKSRANRNPSFFYQVEPRQVGRQAGQGFAFSEGHRLDEVSLRIFSTSEVTALHETGGTVRPAKGSFMAIPIRSRGGQVVTAESGGFAFSAGVRRKGVRGRVRPTPSDLRAQGAEIFRRGNLLYVRSRTKTGRLGRARPAFFLVRTVTIKPRLGIIRAWNALAGDRQRRLKRGMERAVQQAGRKASRAVSA